MPTVSRFRARIAVMLVLALVAAGAFLATAAIARAGGGGGQCTVNEGGQWITVQCGYGGGTGGTGGTGGSGSSGGSGGATQTTCTFTPIGETGARELRRTLAVYVDQGNKAFVPLFQGLLAEIEAQGDAEAALTRIDEALVQRF